MSALAWIWPEELGVVLTRAERVAVLGILGPWSALFAGLAGVLLGLLRGPEGWVDRLGSVVLCAVLPSLGLVALAMGPREGQLVIQVTERWQGLVALGMAGLLVLGATRLASAAQVVAVAALAGSAVPRLGPLLSSPTAAPDGAPDILLITLDTVRADHLAFVGGDLPWSPAPNLEALARRARVYTAAFSAAPLTAPSHATMFSGVSPAMHGVRANGRYLPLNLPWVPTLLEDAGWHTRAWVSASVLDGAVGFDRGFERFDATYGAEREAERTDRAAWMRHPRLYRGHGLLSWRGWRLRKGSAFARDGDETVDHVLLAEVPEGRPSFTWVHLYDAHWPYEPSEEAARAIGLEDTEPLGNPLIPVLLQQEAEALGPGELERGQQLYRAGIVDLDRIVGRLLDAVDEHTVIVVVGDHGESLGEHGYTFSHGRLPYAPDTHVPLIIAGPGVQPGVVDTLVGLAQLAPALLELAGLPVPLEVALPAGRSLLNPDPEAVVISTSWREGFNTVDEDLGGEDLGLRGGIAVRRAASSCAVTSWEPAATYHRGEDPRELVPVEVVPGTAEDCMPVMREALARPVGDAAKRERELGEALEALGYMER